MPQLFFTDRTRRVDLVAEDKERNLGELLNGEESIELRLGFGEPLKVGRVDEEDDAIDLREVIAPKATRYEQVSD